jgi:hypothetical protein
MHSQVNMQAPLLPSLCPPARGWAGSKPVWPVHSSRLRAETCQAYNNEKTPTDGDENLAGVRLSGIWACPRTTERFLRSPHSMARLDWFGDSEGIERSALTMVGVSCNVMGCLALMSNQGMIVLPPVSQATAVKRQVPVNCHDRDKGRFVRAFGLADVEDGKILPGGFLRVYIP